MGTFPHPIPPSEADKFQDTGKNPQPTSDDPIPSEGAARSKLSAQRIPTSKSSPLLMSLSRRDLLHRISTTKRANTVRIRTNKREYQSLLPDHWPALRPASLPTSHRQPAPISPLPRSLPGLGWLRDSSFRIRLDPPRGLRFHSRTRRRVPHLSYALALSHRPRKYTCLPQPTKVQTGSPLLVALQIFRPCLGETDLCKRKEDSPK